MSGYPQLAAPAFAEFEEKRSRFLCFLYPASGREQALEYLQQLKVEYPDARHHCWAYLIGDPAQPQTQAYSDDGEPGGTAGKPMLNVLVQRGLGDVCAIVVRYFGGVKLGAGGLVRAYGSAVSRAVDVASVCRHKPHSSLQLRADFSHEALLRRLFVACGAELTRCDYAAQVSMAVSVESDKLSGLRLQIQQMTSGAVVFCSESGEPE